MEMCLNCRCDQQDCLGQSMQVLEITENRVDAPNAKVCRSALKEKLGSKRARYLIDKFLQDKVINATKLYPRRHIIQLQNQPLKLKSVSEESVAK